MHELDRRRASTLARIDRLREILEDAEKIVAGRACVYATGSFGRREASDYSDLDLFIVSKSTKGNNGDGVSMLPRLDEICVKAELIEATRELGIPEFDGDGRYLIHHPLHLFTKTLGTPEDDVTNTFTARLLLLLESYPLLETTVYKEITAEVIASYWRDYEDHKNDFIPAFLTNDILRLWRTFCVNYEARTEREPDEKKAKGKIKNYKLKHSRLLTCFSAILYLLAIHRSKHTVSPSDALEMIYLSPTDRLQNLFWQDQLMDAHGFISGLLKQYGQFLETTNYQERELVSFFMNKHKVKEYFASAYKFGDLMFDALTAIGGGSRFHRLLVV